MKANASECRPGPKGKNVFRVVEFKNASGTTSYRVTGWTLDGKRVRANYATHAEAVNRMQELEIHAANLEAAARPVVTRLTPAQVADAEAALSILGERSLRAAAQFYLDNYRDAVTPCKVSEAFEKFIAEKMAANKRPLTIKNLEAKCKFLISHHGNKLVSDITDTIVADLINGPGRGPVVRDNYRRGLNGFFAWAKSKGYTPSNPVDKIQRVEQDETEPAVLSLNECSRLMQAAEEHKGGRLVPYVALALFAGIRPDKELQRITWDDIDADSESITISGKVAKMRGRRTVEAVKLTKTTGRGKDTLLPSNLFQWLAPHVKDRTPIKGINFRKDFDTIKLLAGFGTPDPKDEKRKHLKPWVQDYMRHTAISYHFALFEHEGKTAKWAGNSPDIVHRKYKGLVKPSDVHKFWSITPGQASNVIQLPKEQAA